MANFLLAKILIILFEIFTISSSSSICPNPVVVHLTGPHGVITTPNFPGKFPTPLCYRWVIDSDVPYIPGTKKTGNVIRIYLTQLYLHQNLTFKGYEYYPFSKNPRRTDDMPIPGENAVYNKTNLNTRMYSTGLKYFAVQVELSSPYANHFRAVNFLDVYGFNITYEIVSEKENERTWNQRRGCSFNSCSQAGNCIVESDFSRFYCSCLSGRYGDRCEYSAKCDPKSNITFCHNGGICRMHGYDVGSCSCPPGFRGTLCQFKVETPVRECPGPDCEEICEESKESQHQPCSCHTGRIIPKGWMRYEVTLQSSDQTLPQWDSRTSPPNLVSQPIKNYRASLEAGIQAKLFEISGHLEYENKTVNSSVSMVSFGPASKFSFQFFGPNATFHEENIKNTLTNTTLYIGFRTGTLFKFASYPALSLKKLSSPNTKLRVGQDFSITCEAEGSRRVTFKWFKDGVPINPSAAIRQIHENPPKLSKDSYASHAILMFDSATGSDRGVFTCQVSDMGEEHCQNITIDILQVPVIQVEPMSLTLNKESKDQVILCTTENEVPDQNFTYSWTKNFKPINTRKSTNEIIEKLLPYGSSLRIKNAQYSAIYSCVVENNAGINSTDIEVRILESINSLYCRAEVVKTPYYKLAWNKTSIGQIAKQKCPPDYYGFVQRKCAENPNPKRRAEGGNSDPVWGHSDFSRCVSKELRGLNGSIQSIKMGFSGRYHLLKLARRVNNHLDGKSFLYVGECDRIVRLLVDIGNYAFEKRGKVGGDDETFLRTFLNGTTKLLRFPGSCSSESTVISLNNLIHRLFTLFTPSRSTPSTFHSELVVLEKSYLSWTSLPFPLKTSPWASVRLEVPNDEELREENVNSTITFSVIRNLTLLVTNPRPQWTQSGQKLELITPILFFNASENYRIFNLHKYNLFFNIPKETGESFGSAEVNLTCGSLDDNPGVGISWKVDACHLIGIPNNVTVHCACEQFGQYGVLRFKKEIEILEQVLSLHWMGLVGVGTLTFCSLFAFVSIISHLKWQLTCKSIYTLKLLNCFSICVAHILVIYGKPTTLTYYFLLPITSCSLFILSLSTQLSISLKTFLSTKTELYPWFRTVPVLTILFTLFVSSSLPLWTATGIWSYWRHIPLNSYEFILDPSSPVLLTLFVTVILIGMLVILVYWKALGTIKMLRSNIGTDKIQSLVYRMKSLNRMLFVTIFTIISMTCGIFQLNFPNEPGVQSAYGISTVVLAFILLYSYTIKSEYPIPARLAYRLCSHQPDIPDPEIKTPNLPNHPPARIMISNNNSNADSESKYSRKSNNSFSAHNAQGEPLLPILRPIQEDSDFHIEIEDPISFRTRNLTGNSDQSTSDPETIETLIGSGSFESRSTRHGSLVSGNRVTLDDNINEYNLSKSSNPRRKKSNSTNGSLPQFQNVPQLPNHHQHQPRTRSQSVHHPNPSSSSDKSSGLYLRPSRGICLLSNSDPDYVPPSIPSFGSSNSFSRPMPLPPIPRKMSSNFVNNVPAQSPTSKNTPLNRPTYPPVPYVPMMKMSNIINTHYQGYESMDLNSQKRSMQIDTDEDGGYETVRGE